MTEAIANPGTLPLSLETFGEIAKKPLLCLPAEVRPAVLGLWTVNRKLFPSALELATTFAVWLNEHGLTKADVVEICRAMTAPARMATFKFPADLTAALAEAADTLLRRRKQADEQRNQRLQFARHEAGAVPPAELSKLLQSFTAGSTTP